MRLIHPAAGSEVSDAELARLYSAPDGPWLRVNFVASADGAATVDGRSEGLSGDPDQRVFKILRDLADAVLVGAGTLRVEDYNGLPTTAARRAWRRAAGLVEVPTLVVVSSALDLSPTHRAFTDAPARPIIVTHASAPAAQREKLAEVADIVVAGESVVDLSVALRELAGRGLRQVLSEGGPTLLGSLQVADLVDELCLTVSPMAAGPGAPRITAGGSTAVRGLRLEHVLEESGMLLLRYVRD